MAEGTKSIRFHILIDESFKKMVDQAAHESWMSVGQYIRDVVTLFQGADYDTSSDLVMTGKEVGLEGLEQLRAAAQRRGISVRELCESLCGNTKSGNQSPNPTKDHDYQISLFQDPTENVGGT